MIASLRGRLIHKDAEGAVVECGGVGYAVSMSLTSLTRLAAEGQEVTLLVHTHLSQDALRLFGFLDASERVVFETLIGTPGVGPRLALAILSTFSAEELADVVSAADRGALTRIPGVGAKKAERLLVELKGKLDRLSLIGGSSQRPGRSVGMIEDLVSALVNLGFAANVSDHAARQAIQAHPAETDLASLVREALRLTTRPS